MAHLYKGSCRCGEVRVTVTLPHPLATYTPRACDCAFCTRLGLSYLSDPAGNLVLQSRRALAISKQGSRLAEFLTCTNCGVIVAVMHPFTTGRKGSVNARLLDEHEQLQEPAMVSPRLLKPDEKLERWRTLWFPMTMQEDPSLTR